jgi:hypothetical protein
MSLLHFRQCATAKRCVVRKDGRAFPAGRSLGMTRRLHSTEGTDEESVRLFSAAMGGR